MLTYRTGAAGAPSAARAMGEHLMQQTLSPEMAAMAEYYHQGLSPPTPAEAAAARYASEASGGRLPNGELLDVLVTREADRLAESTTDAAGRTLSGDELAVRALGAFVAAGLVDRDEAIASLGRLGHERAERDGKAIGERLDSATDWRRTGEGLQQRDGHTPTRHEPGAGRAPWHRHRKGADAGPRWRTC